MCSSAVSRSRAGGSADVKRGHPSAVPAEVRQKLQDLADTRTNKNQWEFKDFKKEVSDALAESAKQHCKWLGRQLVDRIAHSIVRT